MNKFWGGIFALLTLFFVAGCSNHVTTKDTGTVLDIKITFRSAVDLSRVRYYLILSPTRAPLLPNPVLGDYLPVPGATFDSENSFFKAKPNGITYYYQNYFSTWSDYVVVTSGTSGTSSLLFSSGGAGFDAATDQNLRYRSTPGFQPYSLRIDGAVLQLVLPLSYFPLASNQLYFNILTSQKVDASESGEIKDALEAVSPLINLTQGSKIDLRSDPEDFSILGSTDIVSWEAQVR